ncbi:Protein SYS1 [Trichinella pseudospiralis]
MANGFYSTKRDPLLLALQILAMQALFYSSLSSLQAVVNLMFNYENSLNQIFDIQAFRLRNWENVTRLLVNVVNSVLMAIALRFVVCRAKLCLDFACTFYIFHFLACWISKGAIPTVASWWLLQLALALMFNFFWYFSINVNFSMQCTRRSSWHVNTTWIVTELKVHFEPVSFIDIMDSGRRTGVK